MREWGQMMSAYAETYASGAQRRLGAALDFAINGCAYDISEFYRLFLDSPVSQRFGAGDPAIVAGRSGEELALEAMGIGSCPIGVPNWRPEASASPEYWTGWALAFFQWASGMTFAAIDRRVGIEQVRSLYNPYHEMDVRQFCDRMDELAISAHPQTNLQELRMAAGLSQSQLAVASGVPLRTLQQYEQRQKDVNRARAEYVVALARALHCHPEDILEHRIDALMEYAAISF